MSTFNTNAPTDIYRRVLVRMWSDNTFMRLSPLPPSGQSLYLYALTGPQTGPIPGVFVCGRAAMAEALNWEDEDFAKAFDEVLQEALCEFHPKTRLWFIPGALKHNMPANPNVVKSWRGPLALLPECDLRDRIIEHFRTVLFTLSDAFGKAFDDALGSPSDKPFAKPSGKALPKHSAKQRTENREQRNISSRSKLAASEAAPAFQTFWAKYPRKVGKPEALKAFNKIAPSDAVLASMLRAIDAQDLAGRCERGEGQYVPHPATWLNQSRWEDEVSPRQGSLAIQSDSRPAWATNAGFATRFDAENAGCREHNAHQFRNGSRIEVIA